MDKQEKIITIVTVALLVLAAVIVVLVWGAYSNWFKTDFEYLYLTSNGERLQQYEKYRLGDVRLDVHQFGGKSGFSVRVVALAEEDFTYTVDGKYYNFVDELAGKDVTEAFGVVLGKKSFVLHCRSDILDILQSIYPNSVVVLISEINQPIYFRLVVTDKAAKHSFELTFRCKMSVTDIEIDPDHIFTSGGLLCVS